MGSEICRLIGSNIREWRRAKQWTLAQLGEALEVSYQQVQKYEKGVNRMPVDMMVALVDLFGCSMDEICGRSETPLNPTIRALATRISSIEPPSLKLKIIELIEIIESEANAGFDGKR